MSSSIKRARVLVAMAVSACAILALSAATASAAPVPAWWTNPGAVKFSGTINLKLNGANEKSCTPQVANGGSALNAEEGGVKQGALTLHSTNALGLEIMTEFNCTGGTHLQAYIAGETNYESGYFYNTEAAAFGWTSPYGAWNQNAWKIPWTNGSGSTQSTLTFSNTKIGASNSGTITATGTLTVSRSSGELLTLTH